MRGASRCFLKTPIFLIPDHLLSVCKPGPVFPPTELSGKGRYPQFQRGMKNQGCAYRDACHVTRASGHQALAACDLPLYESQGLTESHLGVPESQGLRNRTFASVSL